ncbi:MAG: hypothetical protein LUG21_04230 [Clostridiales bacterium]|nr:hypothetical protein [Clostridiales bacterium]
MKKIIVSIVVFCIAIINCTPVFADELSGKDTIDELKQYEDLIIESANQLLSGEIDGAITKNDLNYGSTVKIYVDTEILKNDKLTAEDIKTVTDNSKYVYYMPIYIDGKSACLTISKGLPLDEAAIPALGDEGVEYINSIEGKWNVPAVEVYPNTLDCKKDIENFAKENNLNSSEAYLFGGISNIIPVSVAFCNENSDVKFSSYNMDSSDSENKFGELYSFDEVKALDAENALKDGEAGSPAAKSINSAAAVTIAFVALFVIIVHGALAVTIVHIIGVSSFIKKSKRKNIED